MNNLFQTKTKKLGRTLLMEHLPDIKFRQSIQGVILIIFSKGFVFFYPLNEQENHSNYTKKILTIENSTKKNIKQEGNIKNTNIQNINSDPQVFTVYDYQLPLKEELHHIFSFNFITREIQNKKGIIKKKIIPPKKILLSPNKRLLLVIGATYHNGLQLLENCLLVYQIEEEGEIFKIIFYDLSFTFLDACFSPDSKYLVVILRQCPGFIFMLYLPVISKNQKKTLSFTNSYSNENIQKQLKFINYEARNIGPLSIFGPAKGIFGEILKITHISCNYNQRSSDPNYFHFITWNDDGIGEYCFWQINILNQSEISHEKSTFQYLPKLLIPKITDKIWLEDSDTPKHYILDIQFSSREHKLLLLVKRENFQKKGDNGIGLQMIKIPDLYENDSNNLNSFWYQVTDDIDDKKVCCLKWTNTLLLGTSHAASVIIKGKGLFELADYHYGSQFQGLYEELVNDICNFIQIGRYYRFWITCSGNLHVIEVQPQIPSSHPEWNQLFQQSRNDLLAMRILGRRIGYFINDISECTNTLESLYLKSKHFKKEKSSLSFSYNQKSKINDNEMERIIGFHLYLCWFCKRSLLKPLLCSRCKTVVYCSKECQINDYLQHHSVCK